MERVERRNPLAAAKTGLLAVGLLAGVATAAFTAPDLKAGKALFDKNCIACHFADGRPKLKGSPDLSKKAVQAQWTDEQMTKAIMDGTKRMPPYKSKMNAAQVSDLVAYTRSLGK